MRKSQASLFIIIGLIILTIFSLVIFRPTTKTEILTQTDFSEEQKFSQCVEEHLENLISITSLQGGYPITPPHFFELKFEHISLKIPYYFKENTSNIPTLERIEKEISYSTEKIIKECKTPDIKTLDITKITSIIQPTKIIVQFKGKIIFSNKDREKTIESLTFEKETYLKQLYDTAKKITEIQKGNLICITCKNKILEENNISMITEEYYGKNSTIIAHSLKKGKNIFQFAHKLENSNEYQEDKIKKETIEINATIGYPLEYDLNLSGDFTSDTIFPITKKGVLSFTPKEEDIGTHIIKIEEENKEIIIILNIIGLGQKPTIKPIGFIYANIGEELTYQIEAENTDSFSSEDININALTGEIKFTPTELGEFEFTITAISSIGLSKEARGVLIVTN